MSTQYSHQFRISAERNCVLIQKQTFAKELLYMFMPLYLQCQSQSLHDFLLHWSKKFIWWTISNASVVSRMLSCGNSWCILTLSMEYMLIKVVGFVNIIGFKFCVPLHPDIKMSRAKRELHQLAPVKFFRLIVWIKLHMSHLVQCQLHQEMTRRCSLGHWDTMYFQEP